MIDDKIDIRENYIKQLDSSLLSILLQDKSSGRNIIWATDNYKLKGSNYESHKPITVPIITGRYGRVIKPRVGKSKKEQQYRVRKKAEVFTPSWICNAQNNLIDNAWFGRENVFNVEDGKTWKTNPQKITFPEEKTWQDYVSANRMEISCGEAPYLCSRYDTVTGKWIELNDRIGILDRKIRIINENTESYEEWIEWVKQAYKATYAFEWQGDSLLIARENLLFTFIDYYEGRFSQKPDTELLKEIAKILSWNIWQMDGTKYVIPLSCQPVPKMQMSMFDDDIKSEPCPGCLKGDNHKHIGIYCKIMDWQKGKSIRFISLLEENKQ
ncbi:MAG: restriction endonuclease subunit M [Candidatus Coproplasma sp.]